MICLPNFFGQQARDHIDAWDATLTKPLTMSVTSYRRLGGHLKELK